MLRRQAVTARNGIGSNTKPRTEPTRVGILPYSLATYSLVGTIGFV